MVTTRRAVAIATLVLIFCAGGIAGSSAATGCGAALAGEEAEKPKKSVDAVDVYLGDARKWDKPAEVDADKVYAKIDEYKEIVEKGLKPNDPKYEILMSKASKRFTCAVKKAAKDGGYDLVARIGSVKGVDSVPDITSDAIAKL
jgi:hypothetical protein